MNVFVIFCKEITVKYSVDPDQRPRSAASERGLYCLHMSSKRNSSLKEGKRNTVELQWLEH